MVVYIDSDGNKYGFETERDDIRQPDWAICQPKEDGSYFDYYNTDGTPNLDYVPVDLVQEVPQSITMRQARLYLLSLNLLDDIELIVAQNRAWYIEWEYANEVLRTNQLIPALQESLALTDEQVDTMFIEASKL